MLTARALGAGDDWVVGLFRGIGAAAAAPATGICESWMIVSTETVYGALARNLNAAAKFGGIAAKLPNCWLRGGLATKDEPPGAPILAAAAAAPLFFNNVVNFASSLSFLKFLALRLPTMPRRHRCIRGALDFIKNRYACRTMVIRTSACIFRAARYS
eukprot:g11327.t1